MVESRGCTCKSYDESCYSRKCKDDESHDVGISIPIPFIEDCPQTKALGNDTDTSGLRASYVPTGDLKDICGFDMHSICQPTWDRIQSGLGIH